MQETNRTPTLLLRVGIAVILICAAASIPQEIPQGIPQHALDRHGADAIRAHEATALEKLGKGGQFNCPGGKQYHVAPLKGWVEWAVRILYDGVITTEFITTDRGYLARSIEEDKCKKEWQDGHP